MSDPITQPIADPETAGVSFDGTLSFEAFYDAESSLLFRRLWLVTGNSAEAEELMQDAFLKVWERWDKVGRMDAPAGYLYVTAMNLFRKRYNRAKVALRKSVGLAPSADDFEQADDRQTVRQVLATLPPRQRAALVLTELLGYSAHEAGDLLGIKDSTVRALTHQGRQSFRRMMEVDDA